MKLTLPYGRTGLELELPDSVTIIRGAGAAALPDPVRALAASLEKPIESASLRDRVKGKDRVAIVHSDITRATPNGLILPPILEVLAAAGVPERNITLINATGMHRAQTDTELRSMLGDDIVARHKIVQHDARDTAMLVRAGATSSGNELYLNRAWMEADFRIATGFIEPHFFAGYSGGPKAVLPGVAGESNILYNHRASNIDHPRATWGVTDGNPVWEEMAEAARIARMDFLVNVALDGAGNITAVFAGSPEAAHRAGCAHVRAHAMAVVDAPFDIVITSNSGYPLDQNLYQAVKGMSAAAGVTAYGGSIILAAACEEGLPEGSCYDRLLSRFRDPESFLTALEDGGVYEAEQWQVQVQAKILFKNEVFLYSDGLADSEIERAMLRPCADIPSKLAELLKRYGERARVAALPDGPQCIPYVR
ncbi:MAG TPA: nickel-dependent lactate racemase [Spirochaetota bacterium]|nr:nickel-dependent lactate racemase [Spirochaetota bacterium]